MYFDGKLVPVDYAKSLAYMKRAADLGNENAQIHVAHAYENGIWGAPEINYNLSKKYYGMALKHENVHAQLAVAENYLGGYHGYPLDERMAVFYFQEAATNIANRSHRAMLRLALCYYNGKGVQKNMAECARWLQAAAEKGNAEAQWRLGRLMIEGNGIRKDIEGGKRWIQMSADRGDKNAIEMLNELNTVNNSNSSGGCYVATAVYGSYDCPQVWTLRRYRDYTLAETWYGRAFIRTYYAISPTLVKWFGHTNWFKNMWKGTLDRMVADLNAAGVEDSPYEDKVW